MAANFTKSYTRNSCMAAASCPSVNLIPLLDAALLLVVSVLVCLRVILPLA